MMIARSKIALAVLLCSAASFGQLLPKTAPPPARVTPPGAQRQQPPARQPARSIAKAPALIPASVGGTIQGYVYWYLGDVKQFPPHPCQALQVTLSTPSQQLGFATPAFYWGLPQFADSPSTTSSGTGGGYMDPAVAVLGAAAVLSVQFVVCRYEFRNVPTKTPLRMRAVILQPLYFTQGTTVIGAFGVSPSGLSIPGGNCNVFYDDTRVSQTLNQIPSSGGSWPVYLSQVKKTLNSGPFVCGSVAHNVNFELDVPSRARGLGLGLRPGGM